MQIIPNSFFLLLSVSLISCASVCLLACLYFQQICLSIFSWARDSPEITKHRVAIGSTSSAVSRDGSSHMITVLTALHDLIHLSPFSAQRQKRKERREWIEELKNEGKGSKTNRETEKVRRVREILRRKEWRREEGRETREGKKESTWLRVTMQIHFKALVQKVGSDSVCCKKMGC